MATGALDANGIWQYGEDDSETTFSGLLNKLAGSTSSTVTRLEGFTGYTGTLGVANGGTGASSLGAARDSLGIGLVAVEPESIANAGGSTAVTSIGRVQFTGVSSISLNGVFSGYNQFFVWVNITAHSANSASFMRLRAAGVDASGANYTDAVHVVTPTTTSRVYHASATAAEVEYGATGYRGYHVYEINDPNGAAHTSVTRLSTYVGTAGMETATGGFYHNVNTAYDGFTLYPGTGTISGFLSVYGRNV